MTLYSVYEREKQAPAAVADRFSWSAALLPPVHALVHGLWLMLLVWLVGVLAIVGLGLWLGGGAAFWCYVLFALLLGFEAASFRRIALGRRGWRWRTEIVSPHADTALVEYLRH